MPLLRPFPLSDKRRKKLKSDSISAIFVLNSGKPETIVAPMRGTLSVVSSQSGSDRETRSQAKIRIVAGEWAVELSSLIIPVPLPSQVEAGDIIGVATDRLVLEIWKNGTAVSFDSALAALGGFTNDPAAADLQAASATGRMNKKRTGALPLLLVVAAVALIRKK